MFQMNRQRIHTKNQVLFSSKDKSKKLKCCLLQFLFGTSYIAQKESIFPEGRISSGRNNVDKGRAASFMAYS